MIPISPIIKPIIIHLVILAHSESHIVNNAINKGTSAAIIAARPLLIYCSDHVSEPLAIHNNKIPCNEIIFSSFHAGNLYPFNKKKLTKITPEENCLTPD